MAGVKRQRDEQGPPAAGAGRFHSNLGEETLGYFNEIREHLKNIEDDEERQLLADNVLEETAGQEVEIATDAACSRVLESLIAHATAEKKATFLMACVEGDNLGLICTSGPFGSHVLEKALVAVGAMAGFGDDQTYAHAEAALTAATDAIVANLHDMVTAKYGSFVARRLLCVLSGRDVASPPPKRQPATDGSAPTAPQEAPKPGHKGGRLSTRVEEPGEDAAAWAEVPFPHLLDRVAGAVAGEDFGDLEMAALQCDPFAGPFLQALLRACVHSDSLRSSLTLRVLGGSPIAGAISVTPDALYRLLTDRNGSHLMEAVFEAAPDDIFQKLCTAAFRGRMVQLAQHPSANFAVQAALAAVRRPQQLKRMFEDLRPHLGTLLRARRGGVIAVLLAAAGRLQTLQADCAAALWHAAESGLGAAGATPLHSLLTLDTTAKLGEQAGTGARLSPLGCAALLSVLRYPAESIRQWTDALAALTPAELATVARDPGGCRVIECYLTGAGSAPKRRRRMLQALAGGWAAVASSVAGCRFVETCHSVAEPSEKGAITAELAAAAQRLAATPRGATLLRVCHVDAYRLGAGDWQRKVAAAETARREFAELFSEEGEEQGKGEQGREEATPPAAEADDEAELKAQRKALRKAKRQQKRDAAAAAAEEAAPEVVTLNPAAEEVLAQLSVPVDAAPAKKRSKKSKKPKE